MPTDSGWFAERRPPHPVSISLLKVNNRDTRTRCERYWRHSGILIVNFEHISHLVLVFLLLTLSR